MNKNNSKIIGCNPNDYLFKYKKCKGCKYNWVYYCGRCIAHFDYFDSDMDCLDFEEENEGDV